MSGFILEASASFSFLENKTIFIFRISLRPVELFRIKDRRQPAMIFENTNAFNEFRFGRSLKSKVDCRIYICKLLILKENLYRQKVLNKYS